MKILPKIRRVLGVVVLLAITLLFLDFTGTLHRYLGWLAKIQLLPAVLALNVGVIVVLVVATLLFGRVYCSVICPLGIFQDVASYLSGLRKKGRARLRFSFSKEVKWLRYGVWVLFVAALIAGVSAFVSLLAPYSAYGRIVTNLFQPLYRWGNNLFAALSERAGSYAFYEKEVWLKSLPTFIVAAVTFVGLILLAWKGGRSYCNAVCPVGTTLSFFSRFAMFRPVIDADKCRNCKLCERGCKSSCIDISTHSIDYSRCVDCFNCLEECKFGALHYKFAWGRKAAAQPAEGGDPSDSGRRAFLTAGAMLAGSLAAKAQEKKVDGGLAFIEKKKEPVRKGILVPFGAGSVKSFYDHCTACGLCISQCPNRVLRPSDELEHLMEPHMSFEAGYCRPECTVCSQVCPAGAILPVTPEEKTQIHIGFATVDLGLCVVNADGVSCGNCSRHCPAGAIHMVAKDADNPESLLIPSVDKEACIGCGACENLCPARPYSAIHVDGREVHTDTRV